MGINKDNPMILTAKIVELKTMVATIRTDLCLRIIEFPDNPDIARINKNCFTLSSKIAMQAGKLSPEYHDWMYQYKKIIQKIYCTEGTKLLEMITEAINDGGITIGKEKVLLHPEVVKRLKSLL